MTDMTLYTNGETVWTNQQMRDECLQRKCYRVNGNAFSSKLLCRAKGVELVDRGSLG